MSAELLTTLGFNLTDEQPEGSEADIFVMNNLEVSVINSKEFISGGGGNKKSTEIDFNLLRDGPRKIHRIISCLSARNLSS